MITFEAVEITSSESVHTARRYFTPDGDERWRVSWLPDRELIRAEATIAMKLADTVASSNLTHDHPAWPHIAGWARELDLRDTEAVLLVSNASFDLSMAAASGRALVPDEQGLLSDEDRRHAFAFGVLSNTVENFGQGRVSAEHLQAVLAELQRRMR